ncbi:AraC family transcriptional regulator [Pseudomaricurvus alkylphenolicus]|uniref:AraC family transcriptional regulator n=1 Tax=Pseudomaricurvus alkylphenolicus TaxID=1306991 RepID=UPI001420A89C|nr:AraC family transcriptional regulator [Pseudomaricurvus alkylphenolicus]NIB38577.1 AraC family transcriptional regulator [Pseudomaricurvus alkylphenolicus]
MKTTTLEQYHHRIMKVVDYIWQHIGEDIDVNTLAEVAHFSPYHFHRIYRELMHETVAKTVRRLRLHYATYELLQSDKSIEDIARTINYGSAAAFIRAFVKSYAVTPAAYRSNRQNAHQLNQRHWNNSGNVIPELKEYSAMYKVEIQEVEPMQLVGVAHQGDYLNIGQAFEKLMATAMATGLFSPQAKSVGIYYDDPMSEDVESLRSHACISTEGAADIPEPLEALTITGGPHAVLTFKGPYAELERAYQWYYGSWLPNSNYELADRPPFEVYLNDPRETAPSELLTAIHLPLAQ